MTLTGDRETWSVSIRLLYTQESWHRCQFLDNKKICIFCNQQDFFQDPAVTSSLQVGPCNICSVRSDIAGNCVCVPFFLTTEYQKQSLR